MDLELNQIEEKSVEELSKALVAIKCNKLQYLSLNYNRIGDKGVKELSKALIAIKCSKLYGLDLMNN